MKIWSNEKSTRKVEKIQVLKRSSMCPIWGWPLLIPGVALLITAEPILGGSGEGGWVEVCYDRGLASCRSRSSFTISVPPHGGAKERGVRSSLSRDSGLTSSRSRSSFAISSRPYHVAQARGVLPQLSRDSGLTSSRCRSRSSIPLLLPPAA